MAGTTRGRRRAERLSALDAGFLRVEERGVPLPMAALAVLDGQPSLEHVREHVERRTRGVPRLRQVLVRPRRGLGERPYWADAQELDVARHVGEHPVPPPGDEEALLAACAELNARPLAPDRPLWELWLLPGLPGGRTGLLVRMHHVVADGTAALALLAPLFDPAPGAPGAPTGSVPRVPPLRRVLGTALQLRAAARLGTAPATSLNRPVGRRRRIVLVRSDLAAAKAVAHRHGATANDVVLAAVGGGARRLLAGRGELAPDMVLQVSVPTTIRRPGESGGNRTGVRVVPVPVGEPDPVARLERIAAVTAAQRRVPAFLPGGRLLQRWTARVMYRQRLVNLWLSNLHGPPEPLRFAGARVLELFQLGAVQGNVALAVGVLSYAGQLNLSVVADADVVPDLGLLAAGTAEALERLGAVAPGGR